MKILCLLLLVTTVLGDIYCHNPRGSNNRNRETSVNADNPKRMFDGQNNNKGGYCWGPPMTYYEGSLLQIEWTAQHGCGVDQPNTECEIIIQFYCDPSIRDGLVTDTINVDNKDETDVDPKTKKTVYKYGMHEPYEFYAKCSKRIRNRGLFTADQGLQPTDTAMRTRQENNQNDPHGFECEEERDYYPYWHPSPWRDVVILTSNTERCPHFKSESQNVKGRFECNVPEHNNQADCVANGGSWSYSAPFGIAEPECIGNGFSRDNHLGNSRTGYTNNYAWVVPSLSACGVRNADGTATCALRIRYNISSTDYPGWNEVDNNGEMIDSDFNDANSPIYQDPYVGFGTDGNGYEWKLRLALNTDQYCRTFEDRSHTFYISPRPDGISPTHRIINLNVRGKRGNIVEAYPAVEYDFTPTGLIVNTGDYIHFQWTGCDTNPNYAGEGTQRTDRSNIAQTYDRRKNYPMSFSDVTMFDSATAFRFAHLGQYGGKICDTDEEQNCCKTLEQLKTAGGDINQNVQNCMKLNEPAAQYFNGGTIQMKTPGVYHYMSTRNNNFTNRSQKGSITVDPILPVWGVALAGIGAAGFVTASAVAGGYYYASTHPASMIANFYAGVQI
jgi:hypothetical protein